MRVHILAVRKSVGVGVVVVVGGQNACICSEGICMFNQAPRKRIYLRCLSPAVHTSQRSLPPTAGSRSMITLASNSPRGVMEAHAST